MKVALTTFLVAMIALVLAASAAPVSAQEAGGRGLALTIDLEGPIGPATARYLKDALATAAERRATVVILRLNTPGGLVTSMREIITDVVGSPVPVIGHVAPSGAHAASAGTYILYATHVAAMALGTNLGAATPVQIGGPSPNAPSGPPAPGRDGKTDGPPAPLAQDAMTAKATNDAVALIRSLAELRGRNADWAEKAVREAASLSAGGALQAGVIDLVAASPTELLAQIDGRMVEVAGRGQQRLSTRGLTVETLTPGWLIQLLQVISNPNIAFILTVIGIYGLVLEFSSPGVVAPGVVGTISLLLGLYGLNMLPIDHAGLGLMLLGLVFLVIETYNPTVVLGLGGVTAFVLGAAMLFRGETSGAHLAWPLVASAAILLGGLVMVVTGALWRARSSPVRTGAQAMRGLPARVLDWSGAEGHVFAGGERWQAQGAEVFASGDTVEVSDIKGLTLMVRRRPIPGAHRGDVP